MWVLCVMLGVFEVVVNGCLFLYLGVRCIYLESIWSVMDINLDVKNSLRFIIVIK